MPPKAHESSELYNLKWNSYSQNLIKVFSQQQKQEVLTDVLLSVDGQFIQAHRLVLSACSHYFQKIFEKHTGPNLVVCLDGIQFSHLELVIQFMYSGEVKVVHEHLKEFLALGKRFQVKGLCSIEVNDQKDKKQKFSPPVQAVTRSASRQSPAPVKPVEKVEAPSKKRKLSTTTPTPTSKPTPPPPISQIENTEASCSSQKKETTVVHIPRPPNAFMIFANQWRKKLAVEYPNDSNKEISVRLGNMWKSLSKESKDQFYEDAKKADEEHKIKYPGYYYSPMEARNRKSQLQQKKTTNGSNSSELFEDDNKVEVKTENDEDDDEMFKLMIDYDK